MIRSLELENTGPAAHLQIEFAERLNVFTGDNGLGKTFLLDVVWWALTRTWPREAAVPHRGEAKKPKITYVVRGATGDTQPIQGTFDARRQQWQPHKGRPPIPGVVVYLEIDSAAAVWDPAINYWRKDDPERPAALFFGAGDLWFGLRGPENGTLACSGLLRDWVEWQYRRQNDEYRALCAALTTLSPPDIAIIPDEPEKYRLGDDTTYPMIRMPHGLVPAHLASAGMRRIMGLAYLLTWAWARHQKASDLTGQAPTDRMVVLVDEIEAHLHPQWQRAMVPALLAALGELTGEVEVQLIATTHAPLVLASLEPEFDAEKDALFNFSLEDREVRLDQVAFSPHGTADNWLSNSDVFGLVEPRAKEQEELLGEMSAAAADEQLTAEHYAALSEKLARSSVPDIDPVRRRWHDLGRHRGF